MASAAATADANSRCFISSSRATVCALGRLCHSRSWKDLESPRTARSCLMRHIRFVMRVAALLLAAGSVALAQDPARGRGGQAPGGGGGGGQRGGGGAPPMTLTTTAFTDGGTIPAKYTQAGDQTS